MCSARTSSLLHSGLTLSPSGHPHARSLALPNTPHSPPISLSLSPSPSSPLRWLAGWLYTYMIPGRCCGLPLVYGHGATQPSAGQVAKNTHTTATAVHRPPSTALPLVFANIPPSPIAASSPADGCSLSFSWPILCVCDTPSMLAAHRKYIAEAAPSTICLSCTC